MSVQCTYLRPVNHGIVQPSTSSHLEKDGFFYEGRELAEVFHSDARVTWQKFS